MKVHAWRFGTRAPMTDLTHRLEDVLLLQGLGTRAPTTDLTHGLEDVLVAKTSKKAERRWHTQADGSRKFC